MRYLILLVLISSYSNVHACKLDGSEGYFPENELNISTHNKNRSNISQELYNQIIDKIVKVYRPIFSSYNLKLAVARQWKNGKVNAYANRKGNIANIILLGGMARHEKMTPDGYAMVICHEIGHHLGGAPKLSGHQGQWSSVEGQADYWGAAKCFKKVFEKEDNINFVANRMVPEFVKESCENSHTNENEVALCQRIAIAAYELGFMNQAMSGGRDNKVFDFTTPDTHVSHRTYNSHPNSQCRLDTLFQAALCSKGHDLNVSNRDPKVGNCNREDKDSSGNRPLCWFAPNPEHTMTYPTRPIPAWPFPHR